MKFGRKKSAPIMKNKNKKVTAKDTVLPVAQSMKEVNDPL